MEPRQLKKILSAVQRGTLDLPAALEALALAPFTDLDFAKIDQHRALRCGFAEVVFAPGKRVEDLGPIVRAALQGAPCVLISRVSPEQARVLKKEFPAAKHNTRARTVTVGTPRSQPTFAPVWVVTAGTSDVPVAEEAVETLAAFGVDAKKQYDVGVAGLHRLLKVLPQFRDAGVIIAVAGMEGALPSVLGGLVACPLIAVPTSIGYGAGQKGVAPLLAMLNSCASGISVVNIDNGFGAAMSALRMIKQFEKTNAVKVSKAKSEKGRGK